MIEPLFASNNYQIACKLLDAAVLRQEAIASNIANAETPGYRRIDVSPSFANELRASVARGELRQTAATLQPTLEEDSHARSVRPDGNSVEMERELLQMNRNSAEHQFLSEVVSYNLKQLRMAITGNAA
jgi:flagellar basal-body rod protein FlgB